MGSERRWSVWLTYFDTARFVLGRVVSRTKGLFSKLHTSVRAYPILALLLIPVYAFVAFALFLGTFFLLTGLLKIFALSSDIRFGLSVLIGLLVVVVVCLHLFALQLIAIVGNMHIGSNRAALLRIAQALVATIILFGIAYYYIQLFSDEQAIRGDS